MIQNSSNVLIMGHANPDFGSIGACVGVASLAKHLGVDAKIVVDTASRNFLNCTGALTDTESEDYDDELD
jgi:c-di-AMP phosphodiesterase-like protein